jgi:hypothetical protein
MLLETIAVTSGAYTVMSVGTVGFIYRQLVGNKTTEGVLEKIEGSVTGAELYTAKQEYRPPIYIGAGSSVGVGIPVGGGTDTEFRRTHSKFNVEGSTAVYTNYWAPNVRGRISWINTADQLANVSARYGIDTSAFPVALPIRVHEHAWAGPVWHDQRSARIGPHKHEVARAAAWARRSPYTVTAGVVAAIALIALSGDGRRGRL